jgi:PAS domain S-box-containing protein
MTHMVGNTPALAWGRADQKAALRDLWEVYEAHSEAIEGATREWTEQHPELLSFFPDSPNGKTTSVAARELKASMRGVLLGTSDAYWQALARHGMRHAETGVALGAACDLAGFFRRQLLPWLVEAYRSDPPRLVSAIQVMNDFVDHGVAVLANAYTDCKAALIRAREGDLATTLDSIGDAVIVTDAEGRVVRMNPVAERLTGFGFADSAGQLLDAIFSIENEETGEPVESPVWKVLREGTVVGLANHTVLVGKDGTRRPIADSGAPVRRDNGEIRGVVLVFRDVTEERRAEEALRHWERIFQHATWGVALASIDDLTFRAVNPAYAHMHGYTVEELVGAAVSLLWTPETRANMHAHAGETLEHGRLVTETVHQRKDGSQVPVEVVATTIPDPMGKLSWFVANVQDITERKRLQRSRDRAIELEAENRRIEEANRLKSEFLANMSHELRTPLNSIIGFAELLHDEQVGAVAAKQKEFLGDILTSGRHLLRLINDVLDLAKVEAGKMEFRPEPADVSSLVHNVVQSLSATASEKRLAVELEVATVPGTVLDSGRFKQILYNYVSNAIKFTPERGRIVVRLSPEGAEHFRLEVEDTGAGIAAADVPRLFVAFQQLDGTTTKRHGGTGLGLALTKRLVEVQGGTVGVRPATPQGSIFWAVLPRCPASVQEPSEHRADIPKSTSILVVEDNPDDQAVLVRTLRDAGYDVDVVATCSDAAAAWRKRSYHAITLDFLLPDSEDCRALLELIHRDERSPIPVIAMTIVADRRAAAGFAITDVLTKPVNPDELLSALERGGAPPSRGRPVLVVDDDAASLKLMDITLARLGYEALCFSDASSALVALPRLQPAALVLDLVMPGMDGITFLEHFRASPENRGIPVMIWTVKDLSLDERQRLHAAANAVVQKGVADSSWASRADGGQRRRGAAMPRDGATTTHSDGHSTAWHGRSRVDPQTQG